MRHSDSGFSFILDMKLIIGLGNPGKRYSNTRHNIGFEVTGKIAEKLNLSLKEGKGEYIIGEICYRGNDILLSKPVTYMNNSGIAVRELIDEYDVSTEDLLVICDDLNLPLGRIRFRRRGGNGGNKGLESIIYHIQTIEFSRLRIGIKNESQDNDYVYFVLSKFDNNEVEKVKNIVDVSAEASLFWAGSGIDAAMNRFNSIKIE